MAEASDGVWLPVLPSMRGFGPALIKNAAPAADKAGKRIGGQFRGALIGAVGALGSVFAVTQVTQFFKTAVTEAGKLEQSVGAISSVFGSSASQMDKWSKTAATDVGLTRNEFNELGTVIGAQLKNGGTAMDQLAPKTNKLIGLGADMAAMFGGTTKDAVGAISAALRGERDTIERYGVSLTQAAVDAQAAEMGFKKVDGALSQEATQAATTALILEQTADAHGTFAKEADTFAGKQQRMAAQWGNLTTKVGKLFLPVLTGAIGFMSSKVLPIFEDVVSGARLFGQAFTDASTDIKAGGIVGFMGQLGVAARVAFTYFQTNVLPVLQRLGAFIVGTLVPGLMRFARWIGENRKTIAGVVGVITALMLPVLLRLGVQYLMVGTRATVSSARQVAAWFAAQGAAIKAGAVYVAQSYRIVAGWVRMAVAATVNGLKMAAVWTGTIIRSAVAGAASFAVQVGRVVAGWTLMAARSLVMAARMAASWIIALGPIAWITAAVIAIVALVIANWSKIKKWTVKIWGAVVDCVVGAWRNVKKWTINLVTSVVSWITRKFNAFIKFNMRIWRTIWTTVRDAWQTVKNWTIRLILKVVAWVMARFRDFQRSMFRVWTAIKNVVGDAWKNVRDTTKRILRALVVWVLTKFRDVRDTSRRIWNRIEDIIGGAWDGVKNKIHDGWNFIKNKIFNPLKDFITKTIPNAFRDGVKGIESWWNDLKAIAKKPVSFMVNTVYNKGIRRVVNAVADFVDKPGWKLDPIKGFRSGGYTGRGPAHEAAGVVHKGEYVLTKKQVDAAGGPKGAAALADGAAANGGRGFSPIWGGFQNAIRSAGRLFVGTGAGSAWQIPAAASMWDKLAGLRVRAGRGSPQATTGTGALGSILAWATGSGNITFNTGGLAPGLSRMAKRATAAHEIGHVLGLPHTMGASIMQPTIGKYMSPTAMDKRRLESLYGAGSRAPGGGGFDLLGWIADKILDPIKSLVSDLVNKIPGAGGFADMAIAVGKKLFETAKDWAIGKVKGEDPRDKGTSTGTNKFGAYLHDNGGQLQPGLSAILNNTRKPEAVLNSRQWSDISRLALSGGAGGDTYHVQLPERATVNDLVGAVNFQQRRHARGGRR